ncbi:MAG TPA: hypothetical protein VFZ66_07715 [Herpetosiphonaceae bacterium]
MEIYAGNAREVARRGWFVGHFMGLPGAPLHSSEVESKWGDHPAGQTGATWSANDATTISILVRGRFRISFPDRDVLLEHEGDFVLWGPHVPHSWRAEARSSSASAGLHASPSETPISVLSRLSLGFSNEHESCIIAGISFLHHNNKLELGVGAWR